MKSRWQKVLAGAARGQGKGADQFVGQLVIGCMVYIRGWFFSFLFKKYVLGSTFLCFVSFRMYSAQR